MLRHRLLFGALMTILFTGLVVFDGWMDGSLTSSKDDDARLQGTLLAVLVAGVLSLGVMELARLAAAKGLVVLNPACAIGVILLSTAWYWSGLTGIAHGLWLSLTAAVVLAGMLLHHHARFGMEGILVNCGISCFTLLYLGLLPSFVLGIRIERGLWPTLMFFFAVKSSDIGAYTFGRLFGRHKFAPRVSPGKTWEGLAGALTAGAVISLVFVAILGIMESWSALIFGVSIALVGQLSDLTESMLKRDAGQKDSSNRVPGFGGILDVIDSPLFAAPLAYLLFALWVQ